MVTFLNQDFFILYYLSFLSFHSYVFFFFLFFSSTHVVLISIPLFFYFLFLPNSRMLQHYTSSSHFFLLDSRTFVPNAIQMGHLRPKAIGPAQSCHSSSSPTQSKWVRWLLSSVFFCLLLLLLLLLLLFCFAFIVMI